MCLSSSSRWGLRSSSSRKIEGEREWEWQRWSKGMPERNELRRRMSTRNTWVRKDLVDNSMGNRENKEKKCDRIQGETEEGIRWKQRIRGETDALYDGITLLPTDLIICNRNVKPWTDRTWATKKSSWKDRWATNKNLCSPICTFDHSIHIILLETKNSSGELMNQYNNYRLGSLRETQTFVNWNIYLCGIQIYRLNVKKLL